jgi:hypothetical protein
MWTKDYDCCVRCGKTDFRHIAKGLCNKCYMDEYRNDPNNQDRIKQSKHKWYLKNGGKDLSKIKREERHYDGMRESTLQRDGYHCVRCGENRRSKLTVHHIDGNGRCSKNPNNDLNNLQTLCRSCHASIHALKDRWAKDYDCCIQCGTIERAHNAGGLCHRCYNNKQYHRYTKFQQQEKRKLNKTQNTNNTSGYTGVHWHKASQKWQAQITSNRKKIHLGLYDTKEQAARRYNREAKKLLGEAAHLNVVK